MAGRPYGLGIYGTGRYGVGNVAVAFEVGGQASIRFSATAGPISSYAIGGATGITLQPQGVASFIMEPVTSTRVRFRLQAKPYLIHMVAGQTQISFSVEGELVKTWQDPGPCFVPCEAGTWTQTFPPWVVREAA